MLGFEVDYNHKKAWRYILSFDENRDGVLQDTEITKGIRMPQRIYRFSPGFGYVMDPPTRFQSEFDLNDDGRILYEEFVSKMNTMTQKMQAAQGRVRIERKEGQTPIPRWLWSERRHLPEIPTILAYGDRVYF